MSKNRKNKKSAVPLHRRQGDVLVMKVDDKSIPENLVPTKRVTLRLGEKTGHHHTFETGAVGYASTADSLVEYIEVTEQEASIVHQDHASISFPKGTYINVQQWEYSPQELKKVVD
jgi:hypothetical protein